MTPFQEFLRGEMKRRDMSMREFGVFVGVSHSTIPRLMDASDPTQPSLDFLIKLALSTQTDIRYIISLVAPEAILAIGVDSLTLLSEISKLPKHKQAIVHQLISALLEESSVGG